MSNKKARESTKKETSGTQETLKKLQEGTRGKRVLKHMFAKVFALQKLLRRAPKEGEKEKHLPNRNLLGWLGGTLGQGKFQSS